MINFTISGNPVSSKNSRPIFINKKTNQRFIGKSKLLKDYIERGELELSRQTRYGENPNGKLVKFVYNENGGATPIPITEDIQATFLFYVKDKRARDLCNLIQAPQDLLKVAGIISDDSIVKSLDGSRIYIDKSNPRTEIEIKII